MAAACAVLKEDWAVLDSGGGGIHFPTPASLMIVEAHLALAPSQRRGHRVPCPPAI